MSRLSLPLLLVFLLLPLLACDALLSDRTSIRGSGELASEAREVPAFSAIRVNSSADVILTRGTEQEVVASADDNVLPYLRTEVEGDTLVVDLRSDSRGGLSLTNLRHPPRVEVTAPNVTELVTTSSGNITANRMDGGRIVLESSSSGGVSVGSIQGDEVRIRVSSSGDVTVDELDAEQLDVRSTSSGDVTIGGGQAASQDVELTSSGNYEAGNLRSPQATVNSSSSGDATVWVTENLEADSSSSGRIRYYGSPAVRGEATGLGER